MPLKYSIQKHNASHLHYDLRLEYRGKAKSWAIPKQPPARHGVKRLAIQTEDHSINYMHFEGEIEEGYGKGTVNVWDKGTWEPEEVTAKKITGKINGRKLNGRYALIKTKDKNWLFFRAGD